jgi:hypothetical protein
MPEAFGYERFLYAPGEGANDPRSDAFERWLARFIDAPAVAPLKHVGAGTQLTEFSERLALARFIASQDMRTPAVRDLSLAFLQRGIESGWPEVVAESLAALQLDASPDAVRVTAAMYAPRVTNAAWLGIIRANLDRVARDIARRPWTIVAAPSGYDWLTSDIGIVKFADDFDQPVSAGPGWAHGKKRWLFPVTPRIAIAVSPKEAPEYAEARSGWLKVVNRQMVLDARTFVASRLRSDFVQRWWHSPPNGDRATIQRSTSDDE